MQKSFFVGNLMSAPVEMKYLVQDSVLILLVSALIWTAASDNEWTKNPLWR